MNSKAANSGNYTRYVPVFCTFSHSGSPRIQQKSINSPPTNNQYIFYHTPRHFSTISFCLCFERRWRLVGNTVPKRYTRCSSRDITSLCSSLRDVKKAAPRRRWSMSKEIRVWRFSLPQKDIFKKLLTPYMMSCYNKDEDSKARSTYIMSRWLKLLERVCSLSNDIRFEELKKILESYGYVMKGSASGSSHFTFRKPGCAPITIPKHEPIKKHILLRSKT